MTSAGIQHVFYDTHTDCEKQDQGIEVLFCYPRMKILTQNLVVQRCEKTITKIET